MGMDLTTELIRLNARYEIAKMDPEWDEEKLNILITAQADLAALMNQPRQEIDLKDLPGNNI